MRKFFLIIIFFVVLISGIKVINAQQPSRDDLERRRASLLNEIAATQKMLDETKKDRTASMTQLKALQAQLNARQKLIDNINQEMGHINSTISSSASEINVLNNNLTGLKKRYAQSVRYAYKNQSSQNMMAFLFASNSFNEAMSRYQYMKKSRDFRKSQAGKIATTQTHLQNQIGVLNTEKNKKTKLLGVEEEQKAGIQDETNTTNQMVAELKGKEKDLSTQIKNSQATAKKLDNAIKAEIRKEVELARAKAVEEARKRAEAEAQARAAAEAKRKQEEDLARIKAAQEKQKADEERHKQEVAKWEEDNRKRAAEEAAKARNKNNSNNTTASNNKNTDPRSTNPRYIPSAPKPTTSSESPKPSSPSVVAANPKPAPPPVPVPAAKPINTDPPSYKMTLTPDVQTISNNFAANRGALPWPVESGYIAVPFGRYQHPLEPKVTMENSGIDIASGAGAAVRTVFEGTISRVVNIAGSYTVIINHGEYFTVYSYMRNVTVKQGDHVRFKQNIGNVGKNDEGENILHFEICRVSGVNNISNENPSIWIAR